jgi:hypothetical protein
MSRYSACAIALLVAILLSGCGGSGKFQARGRVVKGGAPLTLPEQEYLRIVFHPVVPEGERARNTYVAVYKNNDGSFQVVGPDGKGLPPGKYRVAIEHEAKRKDLLRGALDAENSPFVFDVSRDTGEIVIDLDKAAGKGPPPESPARRRGIRRSPNSFA